MRGTRLNLVGQRFGKLTVLEFVGLDSRQNSLWRCKCDCGNEIVLSNRRLKDTKRHITNPVSCGCTKRQFTHEDLTGNKYGRLLVIGFDHIDKTGHTYWRCKCDCGNETIVSRTGLLYNHTKSCGCLVKEAAKNRKSNAKFIYTRYGKFMTKDRIVQEYIHMYSRCYNKTNPSYSHYRSKNINIAKRWYDITRVNDNVLYRDNIGITNFINDMYDSYVEHCKKYGECNTTLDRINTGGDYSVDNCRWATLVVQNNNLSSNRHIFDGEEILTFAQAVKKYIPQELITGSYVDKPSNIIIVKLNRGWTVNQIIAYLKWAKASNTLLSKNDLSHILIWNIDQSIVYEKYPNEERFPEYR